MLQTAQSNYSVKWVFLFLERLNIYVSPFRIWLIASYSVLSFPNILPDRFDPLIYPIIKFFYQYGSIRIICLIIHFHFSMSHADRGTDIFADKLLTRFKYLVQDADSPLAVNLPDEMYLPICQR